MKTCPTCGSAYSDDSLNFCLEDGTPLYTEDDPDEATLVRANPARPPAGVQSARTDQTINPHIIYAAAGIVALLVIIGAVFMLNRSAAVDDPHPMQSVRTDSSPTATQTPPPNIETREVLVPATAMWFDTGISLSKGAQLSIRASGEWSDGGVPLRFSGPNGTGERRPGTIVPSADLGALVGKVGTRKFLLGQNYFGHSPESGSLLLSINDTPESFSSNKGSMKVQVSYSSQ